MKICIDPGHGGNDSGAVGPTGIMEKTLVLRIGRELGRLLDSRHDVYYTRKTDLFVPLSSRAAISNGINDIDLFLSIHCNAGGGVGFEAFTSRGDTAADPWATKFLDDFHSRFPTRPFRSDRSDGDSDKEAGFTVLTKTRAPAVLFECGFIDHDEEEQWLESHTVQIAQCLANTVNKGTLTEDIEFVTSDEHTIETHLELVIIHAQDALKLINTLS
jgi:N-acetylmuramoyl-L-alanine amidase